MTAPPITSAEITHEKLPVSSSPNRAREAQSPGHGNLKITCFTHPVLQSDLGLTVSWEQLQNELKI